jgi:hypothetical protein
METVIQRAFAAVEAVNLRIADLQKTGGMKELKRRIQSGKEGRDVVRYHDFLHAKKMTMLEAIAERR